jgi:hypothetical protein
MVTAVLVIAAFFAGAYWQRNIGPAQEAAAVAAPEATPEQAAPAPQIEAGEAASVGVKWVVPARWTDRGATQMRLATYDAPAAAGSEGGECAVFYFGPSQGGDVEANFDRWIGQFENHGKISRAAETHGGMAVKRVEVDGTYLAPSGPMMESSGSKRGWMLKGAIVEGPNGNIFFKFTGPKATLEASAKEFDALLASLRKG